jgi:hypothetical protein
VSILVRLPLAASRSPRCAKFMAIHLEREAASGLIVK